MTGASTAITVDAGDGRIITIITIITGVIYVREGMLPNE